MRQYLSAHPTSLGVELHLLCESALSNRSFDSDTQRHCAARRAGKRTPRGAMPLRAGQLRRYTDAILSVALASAVEAPAPRPRFHASTAGDRTVCAVLSPGTIAGFSLARDQRPSLASRPDRTTPKKCAVSGTRERTQSQAARGCGGCKSSLAPRGPAKAPRYNRSIDTDVLSAGFAGLLSAGHLRR